MRLRLPPLLTLLLTGACRATPPAAPDSSRLDAVARRYVILGLGLGAHDPAYVDAYYGPDSLRVAAQAESLTVAEVRTAAESLIASVIATCAFSLGRWRRAPGCWAANG